MLLSTISAMPPAFRYKKSRRKDDDPPNILCLFPLISYHPCQTQNRTEWGWITSCNNDTAQVLLLTCDGKVSNMAMIITLLGLLLSISIILSTDGVLAVTRGLRRRWQQELPLCSFEGSGLICCSRCCWNWAKRSCERIQATANSLTSIVVDL